MIALNVDHQLILRITECPPNEILERKIVSGEPVDITAFNQQTQAEELFEITSLHHEQDGWGTDHIVGLILGEVRPHYGQAYEPRFIPVTFLDNELEANHLSLR